MNVARWLVLMVFTAALLGCGKPATPDKKDAKTPDKKTDKEVTKVDEKTKTPDKEKTPDVPTPTAAGPKEAIEQIVDGFANKKPQVIWTALPPKYQQDVKDVMTSYADAMDAEVHNKTFATLRKGVDVLKKQKKNVLGLMKTLPLPVPPEELEKAGQSYDDTVNVLGAFLNSELGDLAALKKADVHAMLSGSAAKIVEQIVAISQKSGAPPLSELRGQVKIELLKSEGNQATLKITAPNGTRDVEMVKEDGKWLPKKMVDQWPEVIAQMKDGIKQINPDNIKMFKPKILKVLAATDKELDKLANAKSPEELQQMAVEAFGAISAAAMMD